MGARARPTVATLSQCQTSTVQGYPCGRVILTQRIFTVMAFKEVYDCEILILEVEKVLLSMTVL